LLQTPAVLYCAIDTLVPPSGQIQPGFDEFGAALDHVGIPAVWVTNRSRLQIDDPRRKMDHRHPFIAEGGCGVYLPEGYFHLPIPKSLRLGRFTCVPVAEPLPAASAALEALSSELNVPVVPLRSLSPRELVQNSGLPRQQAELARHRDFDELFFFAGASDNDIKRFVREGRERKIELRQHGMLWSAAIGASLKRCVQELSKLYARALRSNPKIVGIATPEEAVELFPACNRNVLLQTGTGEDVERAGGQKGRELSLAEPDVWERLLESVAAKA
jgi:predicted mannosyl-3-phosphoglycerate phosphatase (HAD superfamily)